MITFNPENKELVLFIARMCIENNKTPKEVLVVIVDTIKEMQKSKWRY